jgi:hypothetical protein
MCASTTPIGASHGLVGQLIIESRGSYYTDPQSGKPVDSGTIVEIHTTNPLVKGVVNGSFREMALWTIEENPNTDPGGRTARTTCR